MPARSGLLFRSAVLATRAAAAGVLDVRLEGFDHARVARGARDAVARDHRRHVKVAGLKEPVEIIRDQQGIPHIYAKNDDDLFFAQGYVMAQDRLWQLEMWRRWREGRLAEVFGPKAFDYDARTRLMMFRGPWTRRNGPAITPMRSGSSPRGPTASTRGSRQHADNLPVEFKLTGDQARAMDREDGGAPLGGARPSTARAVSGLNEISSRMNVKKLGAAGGQPAGGAGPLGRPRRARRTRLELDHRRSSRGGTQGRRQSVRAWRPAAA